jgi:hypothetical protein
MVVKVKSGFPVLVTCAGCLHGTDVGSVVQPSISPEKRRQLAHAADSGGRANRMSDGDPISTKFQTSLPAYDQSR